VECGKQLWVKWGANPPKRDSRGGSHRTIAKEYGKHFLTISDGKPRKMDESWLYGPYPAALVFK